MVCDMHQYSTLFCKQEVINLYQYMYFCLFVCLLACLFFGGEALL